MSRSIVAAVAVVFACGCGGTPATPPKAGSSATPASSTTEAPKIKGKKGSNSTTAKSGVAPVVAPPKDKPAVDADKPAEKPAEEKKDGAAVDAPAATQVAATEKAPKAELIPASFTKTVTLSVPDMNCEFACYPKVKKTLESVGGVAGMKPDIENHTVTFLVDPDKFQEEKALAALKDAKYPATVKVADAK